MRIENLHLKSPHRSDGGNKDENTEAPAGTHVQEVQESSSQPLSAPVRTYCFL